MKTTHKTKKKAPAHKRHTNLKSNSDVHPYSEKMNTELKNWRSSISDRFLSHYAIPFTRLVEVKLISLQSKI